MGLAALAWPAPSLANGGTTTRLAKARAATPTQCRDLFRRTIPPVATGAHEFGVVAADFDGDGRDDLAVLNQSGVHVRLSRDDDRFSAPRTTGIHADSLIGGDLNHDARPDLVVSSYNDGAVTVLLGDGTGRFSERLRLHLPEPGNVRAVADFNRDTHPDVLATTGGAEPFSLHVLLGDGSGALAMATGPRPPFVMAGPAGLDIGDFDGDGRVDVVAGGLAGTLELTIAFGDGTGGFGRVEDASAWNGPVAHIAVADYNRDGRADVGVGDWVTGTTTTLAGDGTGRFNEIPGSSKTLFDSTMGVISGDYNGDGNPDLVDSGSDNGEIYVWLGDGHGRFELAAGSPEWGGRYAATGPVSGDFNGDGRLDLVGSSSWQGNLRVLLNTGGAKPPGNAQAIQFIQASPAVIARGDSVQLAARLRCHPGKLDLYRRPHRGSSRGRWKRLARVDTGSRGLAIYADEPRVSVEYQWRPTSRTRRIKPTRRRLVQVTKNARGR